MKKQQLIEDNLNLVYHVVHRYYPTFYDDEDIIQTGMVGLCKAAEDYDETKSEFSTFACRCIRNEINMEFRRRKKHNNILSLDYEVDDGHGEKVPFGDFIVGDEDVQYVDLDVDIDKFTPTQICILELLKQGHTPSETASIVGCTPQYVHKTRRTIRLMKG